MCEKAEAYSLIKDAKPDRQENHLSREQAFTCNDVILVQPVGTCNLEYTSLMAVV